MSINRGMASPYQLTNGDVIQFDKARSYFSRRSDRKDTYGLVMSPVDDSGIFTVFEVIPAKEAQGLNRRYVVVQQNNVIPAYGLPPSRDWAIIIDPLNLQAENRLKAGSEILYNRLGSLNPGPEFDRLRDVLDNLQSTEKTFGIDGAPRIARVTDPFERIAVWHAGKELEPDDTKHKGLKKHRPAPNKYIDEGKILDIPLDKARAVGLLEESVAGLFEQPAERQANPIRTLRELWSLAKETPELLEKYIPKRSVRLVDVEDIHPAILNGLAEPRKGEAVPPVTTLEEAYELFVHRFDQVTKYSFITDKSKDRHKEEIVRLYSEYFEANSSLKPNEIKSAINSAWRQYGNDYMAVKGGKKIPGRYAPRFTSLHDFLMPRKPS